MTRSSAPWLSLNWVVRSRSILGPTSNGSTEQALFHSNVVLLHESHYRRTWALVCPPTTNPSGKLFTTLHAPHPKLTKYVCSLRACLVRVLASVPDRKWCLDIAWELEILCLARQTLFGSPPRLVMGYTGHISLLIYFSFCHA